MSALQRSHGNQAVGALVRAGAARAKLRVSQPADPAEREADRVADAFMRAASEPDLSSACACGGGCAACRATGSDLQSSIAPGSALNAVAPPTEADQIMRGLGQGRPLEPTTRAQFELHFDRDLTAVRIHDGPSAARGADSVNARAFTMGHSIAFNAGEFKPGERDGQHLLAHELAHVAQAADGSLHADSSVPSVYRAPDSSSGPPLDFDPCFDLIQAILFFVDEVAKRINHALDDRWELFKYHRLIKDAHPKHGSWDGHKEYFNKDRQKLRDKLSEWEGDDRCKQFQLNEEQQEALKDAQKYKDEEFPARPLKYTADPTEESPVWDTLRKYLPEAVVVALIAVGGYLVAQAIIACFATGACEFGLVLAGLGFLLVAGITAAMRAAGVKDTGSGGTVASAEQKPTDQTDTNTTSGSNDSTPA